MKRMWYVVWFIFAAVLQGSTADRVFDCPDTWVTYGHSCYQFNFYQTRLFADASLSCEVDGAELVNINSKDEDRFIREWLKLHDPLRNSWFTSGETDPEQRSHIYWNDGSNFTGDESFWLDGSSVGDGSHVIYEYNGHEYKWSRRRVALANAYICEIEKIEAFRIILEARGFDYGSPFRDPNNVDMGPKITVQPTNMVVIPGDRRTFLECVAIGHPRPTYKWYRVSTREELNSNTDSRYTLTNGKLTISQPTDAQDADNYQCEAINKYGSVLSQIAQLSFGVLSEFPSDDMIPQLVRGEIGAVFKCPSLHYKPDVVFQWFKDNPMNFINTKRYPHAFVSRNGRLYFSELTSADAGLYYCLARLTPGVGAHLSGPQSPIVTSMPTPVVVKNNAAAKRDPIIHNDFIQVFPEPLLLGQTVNMECMAFGSQPLTYYWTREDKPLPDRMRLKMLNRVLEIANVTMDDEGTYSCHVKRGQLATVVSKSVYLKVEAKPFFVYPLKSRHMDVGSRLVWRCMVLAVPHAELSWYRNSRLLHNGDNGMEIEGNILKIETLDDSHNGMYQCVATNKYGTSYSSAQLRVLAFKPTFLKNPLTPEQFACLGGSITMFCDPEAAPYPTFNWTKDGRLITPEYDHRATILPNGNLILEDVESGDAGIYTCIAKNTEGESSSSGEVKVVDHSSITYGPVNTKVLVNETAFLYCHGSVPKNMDHVYNWFFNGKHIDIHRDSHYMLGTSSLGQLGLYIRSAQLRHTGRYKCVLQTTVDFAEAEANIDVIGPPNPTAGVFAEPALDDKRAYRLCWTDGDNNGAPIQFYTILAATHHRPIYENLFTDVPAESTVQYGTGQKSFMVEDLRPGLLYSFKVRAENIYGLGPASEASVYYSVPEAPPAKVPEQVGGGGGSVGTLKITWAALTIEDQGGKDIGYNVFWREHFNHPWQFAKLKGDYSEFNTLVGRDKFYTEYEVKVQAFNNHGAGPNSSIVSIHSAEDLPVLAPNNINGYGYNESAIMVTWNPMADDRETIRGKILGYIITWWNRWQDDPVRTGVSYPGQRSSGLITGLAFYDSDHYIYVQVYNSAGVGPLSGQITVTTKGEAPILFPRIIEVYSYGGSSIRITWRGIPTGNTEEALQGYRILYWEMKEDFREAKVVDVDRSANEGIIEGLQKGVLYKARVRGYSKGGDGKLSAMVYFTLGGQVPVNLNQAAVVAASWRPESVPLVVLLGFGVWSFLK